jgi:hypothetical protein
MKKTKDEKKDVQSKPKNASQARQHGSPAMSSKDTPKHERDQSSGADKNTTKKQGNSV